MEDRLLEFVNTMQGDRRLASIDEAATKQAVVLRLLSYLGWDPFDIDEVFPEYAVGAGRVDYALRENDRCRVFIEVKRVGEELDRHQEQLLNYSFQFGVGIAVLTNGVTWWFYLPLREGSWEQRRFYTIEIYEQDARDMTGRFMDFLSRENVVSGKSVAAAEEVYRSRQRANLIQETLPRAWHRLIDEADEALVDLLAETTEKLCGFKPDSSVVERFLQQRPLSIPRAVDTVEATRLPTRAVGRTATGFGTYTGKTVVAFALRGTRHEARSWRDLLTQVCDIMLAEHRERFREVLQLAGRKRPYFTTKQHELRNPMLIPSTDIYVETNLSASSIARLSRRVIALFGYQDSDLTIETN